MGFSVIGQKDTIFLAETHSETKGRAGKFSRLEKAMIKTNKYTHTDILLLLPQSNVIREQVLQGRVHKIKKIM